MATEFTESLLFDKLLELQSEQHKIDEAKQLIPSVQHYSNLSTSLSELRESYSDLQSSVSSQLAELEFQQWKNKQKLAVLLGESSAESLLFLRIVNVQTSTIEFQVDSLIATSAVKLVMVIPTGERRPIKEDIAVNAGETNITIEKPETAGDFEFFLQRDLTQVSNIELWTFPSAKLTF